MPPGSGRKGHTPGFLFVAHSMPDRGIIFIDGNNWYHTLSNAGVPDLGGLDYAAISRKLLGPRSWVGTRYHIGRVPQAGANNLYAAQRRFLASLGATDPKISTHLGRLEQRPVDNPLAKELAAYLANLPTRIDQQIYHDLVRLARNHHKTTAMVEKAVDVMIAVDMVIMAERGEFDAAYLLSADGDFTPAVEAVRFHNKKVYAVSVAMGAQLASVVNSYIRLTLDWFDDCRRTT